MITTAIGQALFGWLVADLLSGVFHFWQDRLASDRARGYGTWLIVPARLHHREPLAFLAGTFWYRNYATFALVALITTVWLVLFGPSVMLIAAAIGGAFTTEVHYWAHRPKVAGPVVTVLQEIGLIQSPKHHAGHHRPPHWMRYCVLTDWLNPVLDRLRVWERLF